MIRLALVTNRDGSEDVVDILTRESDGNYYCFQFPSLPFRLDNGRSVKPQYVWTPPKWYGRVTSFFIRRFPQWVTL